MLLECKQASRFGEPICLDYYGVMRFFRYLTVFGLVVTSAFFITPKVGAHTEMVNTFPEDGSVIEVAPANISINFSEPPITQGAAVILADASGKEFLVGPVVFDGTKVSVTSPVDLPPNEYVVSWRVSAEDGHVISGEFRFTFNGDLVISNASESANTSSPTVVEKEDGPNLLVNLAAFLLVVSIIAAIFFTRKK